jgi:hypothetical protein
MVARTSRVRRQRAPLRRQRGAPRKGSCYSHRDATEEVTLADVDNAVTKNAVGGGDVKSGSLAARSG